MRIRIYESIAKNIHAIRTTSTTALAYLRHKPKCSTVINHLAAYAWKKLALKKLKMSTGYISCFKQDKFVVEVKPKMHCFYDYCKDIPVKINNAMKIRLVQIVVVEGRVILKCPCPWFEMYAAPCEHVLHINDGNIGDRDFHFRYLKKYANGECDNEATPRRVIDISDMIGPELHEANMLRIDLQECRRSYNDEIHGSNTDDFTIPNTEFNTMNEFICEEGSMGSGSDFEDGTNNDMQLGNRKKRFELKLLDTDELEGTLIRAVRSVDDNKDIEKAIEFEKFAKRGSRRRYNFIETRMKEINNQIAGDKEIQLLSLQYLNVFEAMISREFGKRNVLTQKRSSEHHLILDNPVYKSIGRASNKRSKRSSELQSDRKRKRGQCVTTRRKKPNLMNIRKQQSLIPIPHQSVEVPVPVPEQVRQRKTLGSIISASQGNEVLKLQESIGAFGQSQGRGRPRKEKE